MYYVLCLQRYDKKAEDNAAKKYNLGIEKLYTYTHWLNVRDWKTGRSTS
jgi:hypothetical protein